MSAADDVFEMKSLASELADRLAGQGSAKARIATVSKEIGVSWNRALEFLSGKARRVDAWEKEHAKRRIAELRDAARRRLENEYLDWLVASAPEHRGPMLDRLEQVLRSARGADGAVAVLPSSDADAEYDQREYSKD